MNAVKIVKNNKEKRKDALLDIVFLYFNGFIYSYIYVLFDLKMICFICVYDV